MNETGDDGITPLVAAIGTDPDERLGEHDRIETVQVLLAHGGVDIHRRYRGLSPLMHAARMGDAKLCKLLLEKWASGKEQDEYGCTAADYYRLMQKAEKMANKQED